MNTKIAFFAFNGTTMTFVHALLNVIDMKEKGYDVKLIIEGDATELVAKFSDTESPFYNLYAKTKDLGIIDCVCEACAIKSGAYERLEAQELPFCREMTGHPSMLRYIEEGYSIIVL